MRATMTRILGLASRQKGVRLYAVVFTVRDDKTIRIISLRVQLTRRSDAMKAKTQRSTFKRNTHAEQTRIRAGIKSDLDTRELTSKDFAQMRPFGEVVKRGRPRALCTRSPSRSG